MRKPCHILHNNTPALVEHRGGQISPGERRAARMLLLGAEYAERGIRAQRRGKGADCARIVRGFREFAVRSTIMRNSAPFRAIWSADLRVRARI